MGTLGDPKPWIPYMKAKEFSQRLCSLSACPPWCYNIFSPPPPLTFPDDKSENGSAFSPLVIAIIGILASAFLLVSYYALISKYCGNNGNGSTRQEQVHHLPDLNGDHVLDQANDDLNHHEPFQHEPWFVRTTGLDEGLIKAITLIKYKKGEGLVGSTCCSVCLGEFLEDDTLRLLPKCCHAFHVACIDTWLKSHSNCPLCRANIVSSCAQPPPIVVVIDHNNNNSGNLVPQDHGNQVIENEEIRPSDHQGGREVTSFAQQASENSPKIPFRVFSDLGGLGLRDNNRHGDDAGHMMMIRSFSMDHSHETQISISGISRIDHREVCQMENSQLHDQSLKESTGESSKPEFGSSNSSRSGVLQCVMNPVAMKRSFSSGRFLFMSKHGRGNNAVLPV